MSSTVRAAATLGSKGEGAALVGRCFHTLSYALGEMTPLLGSVRASNFRPRAQKIIRPWREPLSRKGRLKILRGSLAPEGAVAKITGKEGGTFAGEAIVYYSSNATARRTEPLTVEASRTGITD